MSAVSDDGGILFMDQAWAKPKFDVYWYSSSDVISLSFAGFGRCGSIIRSGFSILIFEPYRMTFQVPSPETPSLCIPIILYLAGRNFLRSLVRFSEKRGRRDASAEGNFSFSAGQAMADARTLTKASLVVGFNQ
jgi:hypothetical protein